MRLAPSWTILSCGLPRTSIGARLVFTLRRAAVRAAMAAIRYCGDGDPRRFRIACIGLGAAYLTRPDLILIVAPLMLYAVLRRRPSRPALTLGVLLAAGPIAAWSAIALYY